MVYSCYPACQHRISIYIHTYRYFPASFSYTFSSGAAALPTPTPNCLLSITGGINISLAEEFIGYFCTSSAQRVSQALLGPQLQWFLQTDIKSPRIQFGLQWIGGAGCPSSIAPDEVQADCYAGLMATLGDCCECIKS